MNQPIVRERTFAWTDPAALGQGAHDHHGLDWLKRIHSGELPPPPIATALGMHLEQAEPGRIVFSMRAEEWMCNPLAVVHGGMTATLLDTVLTLAVVSRMPAGRSCQTVQLNVNYVRPVFPTGERIVAEGLALHVGTTIGTAEGRVYSEKGKMVAHATATLAIVDLSALVTRSPAKP